MVVIDNDYREAILGHRSPIKHNAFRTSRSSNKNKKWCPSCGRALVWFKDAECYTCTECGHTIDLEQKKEQQQQAHTTTTAAAAGGINSVDGLSDIQTRPNRGATKFRHIKDPRARLLKPKSQLDPELQKLVDEQGVTIVRYEERIEQSNEVVGSDDLRANKY